VKITKAEEKRRRDQSQILQTAAVMVEALGEGTIARALRELGDRVRSGKSVPDFRLCDLED
jgi:hypothetical protein